LIDRANQSQQVYGKESIYGSETTSSWSAYSIKLTRWSLPLAFGHQYLAQSITVCATHRCSSQLVFTLHILKQFEALDEMDTKIVAYLACGVMHSVPVKVHLT
jgi:hypothetical protein